MKAKPPRIWRKKEKKTINKVLHNIKYPGPNPRRGYFCYMCNLKLTLLFMWYINACDAFPCGGKNVPWSFGGVLL